jgi:hypothetical protein
MAERSEEPTQEDRPDTPEGRGESAGAPEQGGAEPGAGGAVPLAALRTDDIVVWFLGLCAAKAWEGMGLVPNPASGKVEKDIGSAQLAIDAYGAVFEVLRSRLEEAPRREMETLLTNLRVNFVEKRGG